MDRYLNILRLIRALSLSFISNTLENAKFVESDKVGGSTTVSRSKLQRAQMTRLKKKTSTQEYEYYDHDRRCFPVYESCLLCPPHSGRRCSAMTVGSAARKSSVSATYRLLSSARILCGDNLRGRGYVAGK